MLGRELRLPADLLWPQDTDSPLKTPGEFAENLRKKLEKAHSVTRKYLASSFERQKHAYDLKHKDEKFGPFPARVSMRRGIDSLIGFLRTNFL